jgi:aspartyl-tRNA(Asn)/glutamyl-tRNA(Gln) amidotransferase subunit C
MIFFYQLRPLVTIGRADAGGAAEKELPSAPLAMITRDDVLHVARLARLELSEPETRRMIEDLGKILEYMAQLNELDTSAVPPTAHVAVETAPFRQDEVVAGLPFETALAEAPRQSSGGFAVPAFVDEG